MCGRYATTRSSADLSVLFEATDDSGGALRADYNVAPTDPVPIIRMSRRLAGRAVSAARWGLQPGWSRQPGAGTRPPMINARAETLAGSPVFGPPFARRRCLVPADGWYEWVRAGSGRQPYFMTDPAGGPLAFAGLWTPMAPDRFSCAIVTTAAVGALARVHDRMPLLLPASRWAQWLSGPAEPALLAGPQAAVAAALEIRPVGRRVGNVRADGPDLIARVSAPPAAQQTTLF